MTQMASHDTQNQPTEYDSPWKEILKSYFNDFLAFFLPAAHDGICWITTASISPAATERGGQTSFFSSDTAHLLVHAGDDVALQEPVSSAGLLLPGDWQTVTTRKTSFSPTHPRLPWTNRPSPSIR